jgi:hypothetical protein
MDTVLSSKTVPRDVDGLGIAVMTLKFISARFRVNRLTRMFTAQKRSCAQHKIW